MPQENISIIVDAVNRASKELQRVEKDLLALNSGIKKGQTSMASLGKSLSGIGRQMKSTGLAMSAALTVPLVLLGKAAFKTAKEFEQSMANAFSVMGDISRETKKELTEFAEVLGKKTAFRASEAADAMYKLASAGLSAQKIMGALPGVLDLAAATQSDLATAAEQTAVAMKIFNIAAKDAARITDTLVAGIATSNLNFERITASMKFAGSTMAGFGKTVEETVAALAVFADIGIFGFKAGSGLRRILARLAAPTGDLTNIMKKLKIELKDLNPAANSLGEIFDRLQEGGISTADAFKAFGQISAPLVVGVLKRANDEGIKASELFDRLESQFGATGKAAEVAGIQLNTLNGEMLKLASSIENVFLQFKKEVFGDALKDTVKSIRLMVDKFSELDVETKRLIVTIGLVVAAVGPVILILGILVGAIGAILAAPVIAALIAVLGILAGKFIAVKLAAVIAKQKFEEWIIVQQKLIDTNKKVIRGYSELAVVLGEDIPNSLIKAGKEVKILEITLLEALQARRQAIMDEDRQALESAEKQIYINGIRLANAKKVLDEELEANINTNKEIYKDAEKLVNKIVEVGQTEFRRRVKLIEDRGAKNDEINKLILFGEKDLAEAQIAVLEKEFKERIAILDKNLNATESANDFIFRDTDKTASRLRHLNEEEFRRRVDLLNQYSGASAIIREEILFGEKKLTEAQIDELVKFENEVIEFKKEVDKAVAPVTAIITVDLDTSPLTRELKVFAVSAGKAFEAITGRSIPDIALGIASVKAKIKEVKEGAEDIPGPDDEDEGLGGVGAAAKDATGDIERLRKELKKMQDDLADLSAEFRKDVTDISNTIKGALGEELIPVETITSYDTLRDGIKDVKREVDNLINAHNRFVDEAKKGLDEYNDKIKVLREEAISDIITTFNRALEDQKQIEEELAEAEGDRKDELEKESALNKQIIAEFKELTSGTKDYVDEITNAEEKVAELQASIQKLIEEEAPAEALTEQQAALDIAEKERLILIGKQILATEELANIQKQQADDEFKAKLSNIELTALQLAQDQKRLDDLKKIQEAIAGGRVGELNLEELIREGIDEDALDLAKRAIEEEAEFRAGLEGQMMLLEEFKEKEKQLYLDTAEELTNIQAVFEESLTLSYDRLIEKLKELKAAADAAFTAAQRAGIAGGGGAFAGGQFAGGGYTGAGSLKNIAGVVHKGEWVAPNWMVKAFRPMFSSLENMRKNKIKGFAEGGEVGETKTFNQPITMTNHISSAIDFDMVGNFLKFQLRGV